MTKSIRHRCIFLTFFLVTTIGFCQDGIQRTLDSGNVVVNVWSPAESKAKQHDPALLSRGFVVAALDTANRMQLIERKITNSVKMGFPLGEFWIQTDFDSIDDSLRLASLSADNDADAQALQQLEMQRQRLRLWCDWLLDQHRRLALADYYVSPSRIDNDERFQTTAACTDFLLSMLASGKVANDNTCYSGSPWSRLEDGKPGRGRDG